MYDVIIIGAGMSGLAAGVRLAHFDRRVCILERHTTIGGLNSFYRLNGRNYDVGLHALTNFVPKGSRQGPLSRLLRQLRLSWEELALIPQRSSSIAFPDVRLRFSNNFELFRSEVHRHFPDQRDNFARLLEEITDYDQLGQEGTRVSARRRVGEIITDPLLAEMLFCPILYYGGSRERDLDFGQFSILFRSIFLEGLGRPAPGVRLLLKKLVRKFKQLGGELRLRAGVNRICVEGGQARKIVLDDDRELSARYVLSSAGWFETMRMCDDGDAQPSPEPGRLSFLEAISVLNVQPRAVGFDDTVVFFNDSPQFHYARPDDLGDVRSGLICSPNNFCYDDPPDDALIRITALANYDRWRDLDPDAYRLAKLRWYDKMVASAVRFVPDFRSAVVDTDVFTPITIQRFTSHENGAVYGASEKSYDGRTRVDNLFLCGTDQGYIGIVGSILSGISIANRYLLKG